MCNVVFGNANAGDIYSKVWKIESILRICIIIGINGTCRPCRRNELTNMTVNDIEYKNLLLYLSNILNKI